MNEHNIASFIVFIQPILFDEVVNILACDNTIECPSKDVASSRCIVLIEAGSTRALDKHVRRLNEINGVISTTMVYHHIEPISSLSEVNL